MTLIGGQPRQVRVDARSGARWPASSLDPLRRRAGAQARERRLRPRQARSARTGDIRLREPATCSTASTTLRESWSCWRGGSRPVFLRDVAAVNDGGEEPSHYVRYHSRPARRFPGGHDRGRQAQRRQRHRRGAIASRRSVETLRGLRASRRRAVAVTRNYGETAAEKSNELLFHMLLAVISVTRPDLAHARPARAVVVLIAIPVTLALTLSSFYLLATR